MANPGDFVDAASGLPLLSEAASSAMPQDLHAQAAELIKNLAQSRQGFGGGGMIVGPQMSKPILPQAPFKTSPEGAIPQGPFASVGSRKRADTQALFSNISKVVQTAQDRMYQKKVEKFTHTFEQLSGAIQGYKEGQASGNKEQMEHNAKIINDIVMDKNNAKELSKAFDVNMNPMAGGDKKGKEKPNPAYDGLKAAFAKDQQSFASGQTPLAPQAQALMRSMPQTLQPDPRYQQYLEGLKAGAFPKAGEQLTFAADLMKVQERINANQLNNETKMKMAENLGKAMMDRTKMQQYGQLLRTQMMQLGAGERAELMANALKYRADQTLKGQSDRTNMLRDRLSATTNDEGKKLKLFMDGLDKAAKKNSKDIEDAKKNHDLERLKFLNQQADGIAYQQRVANDRAEKMVGLDTETNTEGKHFGLTDDEYLLYKSIFEDNTKPSGESEDDEE